MAEEPLHYSDSQMEINRLVVGPMDNNVFFVRCRCTGEAVMIDAANEGATLLEMCRRLNVAKVLQTHGHQDHIQALPAIRGAGYPVGVAPGDAGMLEHLGGHDFLIDDGSVIEVGLLSLHAIHTPGHTPGSTCFGIDGSPVLLAGDTLFPGGPGTARAGGHFPTLIHSIAQRLFATFADLTVVMPGHGDDTSIGAERPHLEEWIERGW